MLQKSVSLGPRPGEARPGADVDVLVVIRDGNWHRKEALTRPGYDLVGDPFASNHCEVRSCGLMLAVSR
jgi:hypothetical protein